MAKLFRRHRHDEAPAAAGEAPRTDRSLHDLEEEAAEENPDETTQRESLELELMDEDRSLDGEAADLRHDLDS